jgi:hypothetical protein
MIGRSTASSSYVIYQNQVGIAGVLGDRREKLSYLTVSKKLSNHGLSMLKNPIR